MRRIAMLTAVGFFALVLVGCGQSEQARETLEKARGQSEGAGKEVVLGGFATEGPNGQNIEVPQVTAERGAAEEYLGEVRPIIVNTAQNLSKITEPSARLENQTLTLNIEPESIIQARQAAQGDLERLREINPPDGLEPVHERLVDAYEKVLPAYDNIIQAFNNRDANALGEAAREGLPDIEQSIAEARSILQELERAESQDA